VTGASAGIGAAFARRLARDGYDLILVARRRDRLDAFPGAEALAADLTVEEDLRRVEQRIASVDRLELLVNNAGFGTQGRFFEVPVDGQDRMHRLHILATMRLTHAALCGMVARQKGAIINVSSVAAFGQSPENASYCSTKAWMNSFTLGVDLDLKSAGSPVRVQALCPGFTVTEFHDVVGIDRKKIRPAWLWMSADDVDDASLRGLARGKVIVVPGSVYKLVVALQQWTPQWIQRAAVIRLAKKRVAKE